VNICFVCSEYPPERHGGIGSYTRTLARQLVAFGHCVRVIGFRQSNGAEFEQDEGVLIWRLRVPSMPFGWIWARRSLYRIVAGWARNGEIDLVEAPDYQGLAAYWPKLKVPLVARLHGSSTYFGAEMGKSVNAITYRLERSAMRRADFICSTSRYTAERSAQLFGLRNPRSSVIHNTVSMTEPGSLPTRRPHTAVFSGTITPKKGIVSLLKAWPVVVERCPAAELHVYGKDTRLRDSGGSMWEHLVTSLDSGILKTVHFHGHVDSATLRQALREAGMAVFPSYSEAFALAPMEAMAEGCPTIYTVRSSGRELIEDRRNGLLVEPDRPKEIADAILSLMQDEQFADAIGRAGREHILRHLSPNVVTQRNESFYEECVRAFREVPGRVRLPYVAEEARR
jgi:glycosyltransferase involved in cell wall biosynthesis